MISDTMQKALNKQINAELYSSYLYLSMAAHFETTGLRGFANWMRVQAQEENAHAMKFFDFILERGGRIELFPIEAPPHEWESPLAVFEAVYVHETKVTGLINDLVDQAIAEKDHATNAILQWFVNEQVEEEASASEVVDRLRLIGDARGGLFMLDRELGGRTFVSPSDGDST